MKYGEQEMEEKEAAKFDPDDVEEDALPCVDIRTPHVLLFLSLRISSSHAVVLSYLTTYNTINKFLLHTTCPSLGLTRSYHVIPCSRSKRGLLHPAVRILPRPVSSQITKLSSSPTSWSRLAPGQTASVR